MEVLKQNGINVSCGDKSKLGAEKKSPLLPKAFNKNLPYAYMGFKENGELYIGLNISSKNQGRDSFASKTHHPGTSL